jgi:hypothetical protein
MIDGESEDVGLLIVLEISLVVLSVVAFGLFDLYARACERI